MKTRNFFKALKPKFNLLPLVALFGVLVLTACNDDEEPMPETYMVESNLVEVAADAGQFGILLQAATKAGLADFLATQNDITVFAPTDEAFINLLGDLGASSLDDIDVATLTDILTYHVVNGRAISNSLEEGAVPSLNSNSPDGAALSLLVTFEDGVMINSSKVTAPDVMSSNGVIHVIDKVLLPPTVVDIATFSSDFSTLVSAVSTAGLVETLSSEGPFTVFAPTNDAFDALVTTLGISSLNDVEAEDLASILTYHVIGDNVLSSELSDGMVKSVSGEDIAIALGTDVTINGTIKVTSTDIQGTNGVIHIIDAVMIPSEQKSSTIADIAGGNPDFSILVEALVKTGLVDAVANPNAELTVFAPTNEAFINLLQDLGASSLDDLPMETLTNVLLYHVLSGRALSSEIETGYYSTLSTFADNNVMMYVQAEDGVYINKNTMVTIPDVEADNGVIHVVDRVILPPSVVNIATDNADFSILVQAVVKAGLVDALSASGPFTVFAPNNAAFEDLFQAIGVSGIDDLTAEDLTPILTYHVIEGNVLSSDILGNIEVPTLNQSSNLMIDITDGVKINDSKVVAANIQGSNGVIHVIDKVLLPQ